jgi:hypothetical protein
MKASWRKIRLLSLVFGMAAGLSLLAGAARAGGGISVDAGLTPPEGRWILRAQVRHMQRSDEMSEMGMYKFPFVLAYGVRSDLTLMVKQIITRRSMTMDGVTNTESGFDDFFALAKYKAYRRNTRSYTFGIAPTLALEMPTGSDEFSSDTWDLAAGLYFSWRSGVWAADLNMAYKWNSITDRNKNGLVPGDVGSLDAAFSYQYSIGGSAFSSLFPVLELNYEHARAARLDGDGVQGTGGSVLYISPGLKYATPSVILEALVRVPASWDQNGSQPDPATGLLLGVRFLF